MEKRAAYIAKLIYKSKLKQLTDVEAADLQAWLAASARNSQLYEELQGEAAQHEAMGMIHAYRDDNIRARILASPQDPSVQAAAPIWRLRRWLPYAAALIVALSVGFFLWEQGHDNKQQVLDLAVTEILPGGNRATLTLADGRTINLDDAQTGIIVEEKDVKYQDGTSLALAPAGGEGKLEEIAVLSTPKGGTYQVTLPDGSKVWLNSASTLKYPPTFKHDERVVELEGEAYFSVEKDARKPFKVISAGQEIQVLGTEFNIAAYADENETKTTLVEGAVRISYLNGGKTIDLSPGEQGILGEGGVKKINVDLSAATAWKAGRFSFDNKDFAQIMNEMARWYDIDVAYEGTIPNNSFIGDAYRTDNLSTVLRFLESSDIQYQLEEVTGGRYRLIIRNGKEVTPSDL